MSETAKEDFPSHAGHTESDWARWERGAGGGGLSSMGHRPALALPSPRVTRLREMKGAGTREEDTCEKRLRGQSCQSRRRVLPLHKLFSSLMIRLAPARARPIYFHGLNLPDNLRSFPSGRPGRSTTLDPLAVAGAPVGTSAVRGCFLDCLS